ncbi:MAG TPA: hypothetical protein VH681_12125 [Nitrospiraceae bacterium]
MLQSFLVNLEASSESSAYRVTLFFGPEPREGNPSIQYCVFNVKKRSWKGGIQVSVEVTSDQLADAALAIQFSDAISSQLIRLPADEQPSHKTRAHELLVQAVCWCKLDLALRSGMTQDNQCVSSDAFVTELQESAAKRADHLTSYILDALDLPGREATE